MKNVLKSLVLTMLVSVSIVSCSKSDDGPSTSGNIVGK
jgi:predicted small lipoprotein YifL